MAWRYLGLQTRCAVTAWQPDLYVGTLVTAAQAVHVMQCSPVCAMCAGSFRTS